MRDRPRALHVVGINMHRMNHAYSDEFSKNFPIKLSLLTKMIYPEK